MTLTPDAFTFASPIGPITVTADADAITGISFGPGGKTRAATALLALARRQIDAYFAGTLTVFSLPLAPRGTDFQHRVWNAMLAIPYGETATYGQIADRLRSSPRAVGGACGRNPIPLVIPCHRVLASTGLGGYSGQGGLRTKRRLLATEARIKA